MVVLKCFEIQDYEHVFSVIDDQWKLPIAATYSIGINTKAPHEISGKTY